MKVIKRMPLTIIVDFGAKWPHPTSKNSYVRPADQGPFAGNGITVYNQHMPISFLDIIVGIFHLLRFEILLHSRL